MARPRFTVAVPGFCPAPVDNRPHTWIPDGDGADLLSYGHPDHGVTVLLGRCRHCGVALLSIGRYGTDRDQHALCLELPDAALGEE